MKRVLAIILFVTVLAGACQKKSSYAEVGAIALNANAKTLTVGENWLLGARVIPSDSKESALTFETSNPDVATVGMDGLIKALSVGKATITVRASNGVSAFCHLTVLAAVIPVTGITLTPSSISLGIDGTTTLTATVNPADATNPTVRWSSDNEDIAFVVNGTVRALRVGTAIITATTADGNFQARTTVKVIQEGIPKNAETEKFGNCSDTYIW